MRDPFAKACRRIIRRLGSPFTLHLKNSETLNVDAIFDTSLELESDGAARQYTSEKGVLTLSNLQVDKSSLMGATVATPQGERVVVDVLYPDIYTVTLVLNETAKEITDVIKPKLSPKRG